MVAAIIGSRSFVNYSYLNGILSTYSITNIISGGANGADSLAVRYAEEQNLSYTCFLPEYGKYGKSAPLIRNSSIVKAAQICIAFWDGISKGTKHAISIAHKNGIPTFVYAV